MIGAKGGSIALRASQFFPYPGRRQISLWTACAAGSRDKPSLSYTTLNRR